MTLTNNYGIDFEQIVVRFLGNPKTPIYYANYWDDNFQTRAILFSICVIIRNNLSPAKDIDVKLGAFEKILSSDQSTYHDCVQCLEYLKELQI